MQNKFGAILIGVLIWSAFSSPLKAQSSSNADANTRVRGGGLSLPGATDSELLPIYIAGNIEKKGLVQDLECQALFHYIVEELDPTYKNQKNSIVKRPPDTSNPKVASSYIAHLAYSSVVTSYLSGAGLPEDFVPGPLVSAFRANSDSKAELDAILQETYGECLPRFLKAVERHEATTNFKDLSNGKVGK